MVLQTKNFIEKVRGKKGLDWVSFFENLSVCFVTGEHRLTSPER